MFAGSITFLLERINTATTTVAVSKFSCPLQIVLAAK